MKKAFDVEYAPPFDKETYYGRVIGGGVVEDNFCFLLFMQDGRFMQARAEYCRLLPH